jgi:hypothetical protein
MFDYLIPLLPLLAPLVFVLWSALRRRDCPDCGAPLPVFYSPFRKTRRMWRAGGHLCARCGCETDTVGRKVTAGTAMPPFPARQWALVGVLLLVGLGLAAAGWSIAGGAVVAPPAVAAPPVVALPQQAPPAAPAD